jgi:pyruvate-ferredoxin/flavodoxin oxidoreductase
LRLDSKPPSVPYREFAYREARFSMLTRTHPEEARAFLEAAQHEVNERYHRYAQLAELSWEESGGPGEEPVGDAAVKETQS